eukprot:CAMPEP_0116855330 /NCGR_PEP_ID=MMETSP0418-20121206/19202_1 /TAXON_ID=1158023 /ORGANISM="Astrosyne radiata, Strain 13vi08-1A" /LENGTH=58 /DNA_ID=CAMNT_0004488419 /DNA_START=30 /DNA_END=203 /DNA_ORIENTATION=+
MNPTEANAVDAFCLAVERNNEGVRFLEAGKYCEARSAFKEATDVMTSAIVKSIPLQVE